MIAWMLASGVGWACGGTVCSGGSSTSGSTSTGGSVVQSGESIVFVQDQDDAWTALVQIRTQGAPTGFGWVIPTPNRVDPEDVEIAYDGVMDDLERATAPQFQTDAGTVGDTGAATASSCGCGATGISTLVQQGASELLDAVQLHGVAVVGPYEVAAVGADELEALDAWFAEGGYQIPAATWPIVDDYASAGWSFLVVRLLPLQGNGQGTVDTLRIPCGMGAPSIPLTLTAIAAVQDMEITTYVVANQRYAPSGDWPEVPFDPRVVDPAAPVDDYDVQLGAALDSAGGRGFRTEFAGPVAALDLPRRTLDELGSGPYVTRMQSWASPADMLSDPVFTAAGPGGDVSNVIDLRTGSRAGMGALGALLFGAATAWRRRGR